jgi:hypothetical protein
MEQKLIQVVLGILAALMAWNFKTVNELQLQVRGIETGHVSNSTVHELQRQVDRLEILLGNDAGVK